LLRPGLAILRLVEQKLVNLEVMGHNASVRKPVSLHMKLTVAFLAILVTLGLSACSTIKVDPKVASFTPCCMTGQPAKDVILKDSWEPGGTVVRLVH
jgi:hypothetical protein